MAKIAVLFMLLFLCVPTAILAQGIGQPLGPQPIGTPLPIAPGAYAPTWSAPWPPPQPPQPTIAPTPADEFFRVWLNSDTFVYSCPSTKCAFHPFHLLHGGQYLTVRVAIAGWVQLESGAFQGNYILAGAVVRA